MPEKLADKAETNGRPIPERVEETTRHYVNEAGKVTENAFRMYNELMTTTADYFFDTFNRTMRYNLEIATRTQDTVEETMEIYRKVYNEGFKSWDAYWKNLNKIFFPR